MASLKVDISIGNKIELLIQKKVNERPFIIGIAGGSGSGKSTISKRIKDQLESISVEVIGLDKFFKPVDEMPKYYSSFHNEYRPDFNAPESLKVNEMVSFCKDISEFDVVVLEGHYSLYYQEMRQLMDIKCFITAEIDEMIKRRTNRNIEAGYSGDIDTILNYNKECVLPQYNRYILPTKEYADIIIPNCDSTPPEGERIVDLMCQRILSY